MANFLLPMVVLAKNTAKLQTHTREACLMPDLANMVTVITSTPHQSRHLDEEGGIFGTSSAHTPFPGAILFLFFLFY